MFTIAPKDRFKYPITVEMVGDGGKRTKYQFEAVFKRLSREEFVEVMRKAGLEREDPERLDDATLMRDVLLGWSGVENANGEPVEFSEEARDDLINVWPVLPALATAFIEANSPGGRAKN